LHCGVRDRPRPARLPLPPSTDSVSMPLIRAPLPRRHLCPERRRAEAGLPAHGAECRPLLLHLQACARAGADREGVAWGPPAGRVHGDGCIKGRACVCRRARQPWAAGQGPQRHRGGGERGQPSGARSHQGSSPVAAKRQAAPASAGAASHGCVSTLRLHGLFAMPQGRALGPGTCAHHHGLITGTAARTPLDLLCPTGCWVCCCALCWLVAACFVRGLRMGRQVQPPT
jgi:hypothetical protein